MVSAMPSTTIRRAAAYLKKDSISSNNNQGTCGIPPILNSLNTLFHLLRHPLIETIKEVIDPTINPHHFPDHAASVLRRQKNCSLKRELVIRNYNYIPLSLTWYALPPDK